jgi:NAD(P)-dependent dehydrogenase (short-subunit alcohol dehydrogenase family)
MNPVANKEPTAHVALVTGATKGLGAELALALAKAGNDVIITGRDASAGAEVAKEIQALGRQAMVLACDVSNEAGMDAAAAAALARFGHIDILLCVAGVGSPRRPLWETSTADFHACFDVNVLGVMLSMRAVLPSMVARRAGRVVVISGTYGHKGVANSAIYAASKWALRGLTKSAALEAGPYNVTVNLISPGGVAGPRLERMFRQSADLEGLSYEQVLQRFSCKTALQRLVTGDDIAHALLHLVSDGGRMITGQDIIVDAGMVV